MKRRLTSATYHRLLQRSVVTNVMQFGFETPTGTVCHRSEGRHWKTILGGLYPDPNIQSGRCALAPT